MPNTTLAKATSSSSIDTAAMTEAVITIVTEGPARDRYEPIKAVAGSCEQLVSTLARRYGVSEQVARAWVEDWAEAETGKQQH